MNAQRYKNSETGSNLATLVKYINDPQCSEVLLFASAASPTPTFDVGSDGPENNLPLVAAIAKYQIPGVDPVHILFGVSGFECVSG